MKEPSDYFVYVLTAPTRSSGSSTSAPGRHRAGRGRRRLWTSALAAAVVGAGLLAPSLLVSETPAAAVSAVEQARKRSTLTTTPAPAPTTVAPAPRASAPSAATTAPAATGTPATTTASSAAAPSTTAAPGSTTVPPATTDNPLAGMAFHGLNTAAARAAGQPGRSAEDTAALAELAAVPTATWLGAWSGDLTTAVRQEVASARGVGAVPVFVTYNVPERDCGGYSAGGVGSSAEYLRWVQAVAAGIGTATAVVVVEPDALAQLCGDPAARLSLLRSAVELLEANPGTHTYLDAGNPTWMSASTMAERLRAAGGTTADGFALNVSNFQTTAANVAYGQQVSALLGGAHFVVDTSRNGNGAGSDWCNPPGRAVGERPTAQTGQRGVDAYLWIKRPGESDGTCNGGPAAGTFWDAYAIGLVRGA
ncbi:endoglucanase [Geodermatophilus africanus]|uniref:Glucanase n=1 Tax=Geodermatophilus africanus TaxID=1137993 RepID=A0A1H3PT31_9ACTN|nr:glycoside hydrolase family 6 protein [Geodermatophilus africanus]SDZ04035.1 endoglucanase [Geodermatophilus africanus]